MLARPAQVLPFIGGIQFPANKESILAYAEMQGADKDVLETLQRLPEQEYPSANAISKELTHVD